MVRIKSSDNPTLRDIGLKIPDAIVEGIIRFPNITTQARFICVVQKWVIPLANWHGRLLNLPVGKLSELLSSLLRWMGWVSSELLGSEEWIGLVTFGPRFSGYISFQKNLKMRLNYCPSSAYPFVLWSEVIAKKMSPRIFISFHRKTFRP